MLLKKRLTDVLSPLVKDYPEVQLFYSHLVDYDIFSLNSFSIYLEKRPALIDILTSSKVSEQDKSYIIDGLAFIKALHTIEYLWLRDPSLLRDQRSVHLMELYLTCLDKKIELEKFMKKFPGVHIDWDPTEKVKKDQAKTKAHLRKKGPKPAF